MEPSKRRKIKLKKKTPEQMYVDSFTDAERKAFEIAQEHLQTSFSLTKSLGFQKWKSQTNQ